MAIALDAANTKFESGTVSSTSLSFTCTGSNLILVVMTRSYDGDLVTGVTYNSVAMTQSGTGTTVGALDVMKRWYLIGPSTGTNNITVSLSPAGRCDFGAVSLTGALQSGQPDAAGATTGVSSPATRAITTIANNCWGIMAAFDNGAGGAFTSGTNCTIGSQISDRVGIGYGGPFSPAGSFTQSINLGVAGVWGVEQMSIAPAPEILTSGNNLLLLGVS